MAFRRLIAPYDNFLHYRGDSDPSSTLQAVWVYPKGTTAGLRPVPPELWASSKELESSLTDRDVPTRERAYESLMTRPDSRSRNLVMQAIRGVTERDEDLRQRIFSMAVSKGMEFPSELLSQLIYAEPSEMLRLMALDVLPRDVTAKAVLEHALKDHSTAMRERAEQIMTELDSSARRTQRASGERE